MTKTLLLTLGLLACLALLLAATSDNPGPTPQYEKNNHLLRPENYREWIFLSSGLGMSYSATPDHQMFTNVFVPRWAYGEFMKSGKWPEHTMFVLEERGSENKGSINKAGHFQSDLMGIDVEVKDSRFADKWAYFNFGEDDKSAEANPAHPKNCNRSPRLWLDSIKNNPSAS